MSSGKYSAISTSARRIILSLGRFYTLAPAAALRPDTSSTRTPAAIDTRTGEPAFKLADKGRVILPNGREIAGLRPPSAPQAPNSASQKLYTQPPPKISSPFGAFDETTAARAARGGIGNRLFGRR
jgi:hypothetical protein